MHDGFERRAHAVDDSNPAHGAQPLGLAAKASVLTAGHDGAADATAISADAMTIPLFVLLLFLFDRLRLHPSTFSNAAVLGLALAIAIFTKYSFMALIPAVLILLVFMAWNRHWKLSRFIAVAALALIVPSAVAGASFWASLRLHGYNHIFPE